MNHYYSHGGGHDSGVVDEAIGSEEYTRVAMKAEKVGLVTNILLFIFDYSAGVIGNSAAVVADSMHTFSDIFADLIAMLGFQMSKNKEDRKHPYGHERIECLFSTILGFVLLFAGWHIVSDAVPGLIAFFRGEKTAIEQPGVIAIVATVVAIVSKELLYRYVIHFAKKLNSPTLKATAWHHRSDSFSSLGAMIGVVGAYFGLSVLDPIACIIICLILWKIAIGVLIDSIKNLIDTAMPEEEEVEMYEIAMETEGVEKVNDLKTRLFGAKCYIEVTIGCQPDITLREGHAIAQKVHDSLEKAYPNAKHVFVHVDPSDIGEEHIEMRTFELPKDYKPHDHDHDHDKHAHSGHSHGGHSHGGHSHGGHHH